MTAETTIHPFETSSGSYRMAKPAVVLALLAVLCITALAAANMGFIGAGMFIPLMGVIIYAYFLFTIPEVGFYTAIIFGFVLIGAGRYLRGVQVGIGMDAILLISYIALFINRFRTKVNWAPANKDITYLSLVWFAYSLFEIVNPEARSFAAWFSGRGISLYMLMIVPLALLFINSNKKLDVFLYVWGVLSVLATLKGVMQLNMGVDSAERAWLDEGNYKTHILFGKLRVFSFLSDAGQFGANQAYTAVVFIIYAMAQTTRKSKLFFYTVGFLGIYGMLISGTRGSMSVPLAGFMMFFVLRKNVKVLSIGIALLAVVFVFFKYTTIGQDNYQIRRMRTAFDPNDASLQVRLNNQKILKNYLAARPFGGGIGHGGVKAQKFLPNAFLSQIATDSWYVLIWVEQGVVGLVLHLAILFYVLIKGSWLVMFRIRNPQLKLKIGALTAGMAGVMVASYGNAVLGTMPTSMLIYASMAIILNCKILDDNNTASLKPNNL